MQRTPAVALTNGQLDSAEHRAHRDQIQAQFGALARWVHANCAAAAGGGGGSAAAAGAA